MQKQGKRNVCILKELSGPTPARSHSDKYRDYKCHMYCFLPLYTYAALQQHLVSMRPFMCVTMPG